LTGFAAARKFAISDSEWDNSGSLLLAGVMPASNYTERDGKVDYQINKECPFPTNFTVTTYSFPAVTCKKLGSLSVIASRRLLHSVGLKGIL